VDDKKFLKGAALGGMTEVELGKLAAQKATSDDIKQFGQKLVEDHTKANTELKEVASKDNIPIPDTLDSKHQSRIEKLSKLSGEQFDKAYVKDQVKDHQADIKDFKDEAQNGNDPQCKGICLEHASRLAGSPCQSEELEQVGEERIRQVTARL
jgi:putative membrane protein